MRKILLLCVLPLFAACAREVSIAQIPPAACSLLIPAEWALGISPELIPADDDYASAYVGQTGQLAKANGRTTDVIGIFSRCEAMVNAARPR